MPVLTKRLGKIVVPNCRFNGMAVRPSEQKLIIELERVIREQQMAIVTLADAVRELQDREEAR